MPILGIMASSMQGAVGDYESIQTVTVGGGGASDISFTSIPSTFTHLQVRAIARSSTAGTLDNAQLQFNSDTGSNYKSHFLYGDGSSAAAGVSGGTTNILAGRVTGATSGGSIFGTLIIDILDYKNTNKNTTVRTLTGWDGNGSGEIFFESGLWINTAAITAIRLFPTAATNWVQYSQFSLYGIKG
jgi:hypothetical protein